ncbi:insulinase family protein [Neiella marina]|uniref:Insulinase family protein n=1 Tax=Neiella holothuriorum TaxID=2870530 RepID=A0ABS7EKB6_9GAMM|nr:pitrilysin family protein [Neiella holothuriorum]MBW8192797.1 insulinase family protein [Neiella holothuriorum]
MNRIISLCCALTLLSACSVSEQKTTTPEGVNWVESHAPVDGELGISYDKFTLDNGLTVILHQDDSDPLVHVSVTYHVGSAREEPGMSGFAHFFEHMMFQGSVHAPDDLHSKLIDSMGGDLNGGTNSDTTKYYNTVPANELEKVLWLEADRMAFVLPVVTQEKFEIQRATVKNERAQRYDNAPYGLMWETTGRALYQPEHPYSWPTIGYIEDLNRVTVNDLKAFFLRWYGPNNATLVVAGDFDKQQAIDWVDQYFSDIPVGPTVEKADKQLVALEEDRYVTLPDNIHLPLLKMTYPTVYVQHPDEAPLDFLSQIIGDGKTSVLYEKLVKTGIAVEVGTSHPCQELSCTFNVFAVVNPAAGKSLADVEAIIRDSFAEWQQQPVDPATLEKFQRMFKADTVFGLERVAGKANQLASGEVLFERPDNIAYDLQRYDAVTEADIKRVFNQYIDQSHAVVLSIVPHGAEAIAAKPQNYQLPEPQRPQPEQLVTHDVIAPTVNSDFDRNVMPATGAPIAISMPSSWQFQLTNGINVKGISTTETPTVSLLIDIEGGPLLDPQGKEGLASLTASMMNESTQNRSSEELANAIESLGSSIKFSSQGRSTQISVSSLVEFLPETLALLEEMLTQPAFAEADFMRLKQQTLQFLHHASKDPKSVASNAKRQLLWGKDSRLGVADSGTLATVSAIELADLQAFYQANYSAAMASAVVVGDISQAETKQTLAWLQSWSGDPITLPDATPGQTQHKGQIILVDHPEAAQAVMIVGRTSVPFDATGTYFKLGLTNHPFGASFTSRANQLLREQKGYTYGAFSGFAGGKQQGNFSLSASLLQAETANAVADAISLMTDYAENGPTDDEVASMRSAVTQGEALSYESAGQKASLLRRIQLFDLADDFPAEQQKIIASISKQELQTLAKEWLDPKTMWVLVVANADSVKDDLEAIEGWTVTNWQP